MGHSRPNLVPVSTVGQIRSLVDQLRPVLGVIWSCSGGTARVLANPLLASTQIGFVLSGLGLDSSTFSELARFVRFLWGDRGACEATGIEQDRPGIEIDQIRPTLAQRLATFGQDRPGIDQTWPEFG